MRIFVAAFLLIPLTAPANPSLDSICAQVRPPLPENSPKLGVVSVEGVEKYATQKFIIRSPTGRIPLKTATWSASLCYVIQPDGLAIEAEVTKPSNNLERSFKKLQDMASGVIHLGTQEVKIRWQAL